MKISFSKALLGVLLLVGPFAYGQTTWTGTAGDRDFSNAGNWSNGLPSSTNQGRIDTVAGAAGSGNGILNAALTGGTTLEIATGGELYVHNNGAQYEAPNQLRIGGGSTLLVSGGTVVSEAYALFGISDGAGTLTITSGTFRPTAGVFTVGDSTNQTGTVNLSGGTLDVQTGAIFANHVGATATFNQSGGSFNSTNAVTFGAAGNATYYFTGGSIDASLNLGGITTVDKVDSYGSGTIHVGQDATEKLASTTMTFGSSRTLLIGAQTIPEGTSAPISTVTVHKDSTLVMENTNRESLRIGGNGSGVMNIKSGGTLRTAQGFCVGHNNGSVGVMNIEAGGTVIAGTGAVIGSVPIGFKAGSQGTLNLYGSLSINDQSPESGTGTGALYVGDNGTGTLNFYHGASLSVNTLNIAYATGSSGTLNLHSGTAESSTALNLTYINVGQTGSGTLNIPAYSSVTTSGITIGNAAASTGTVLISGAGAVLSSTGGFTLGASATGTKDADGNITTYGASLTIEKGGKFSIVTLDTTINVATNNGSSAVLNVNEGGLLEIGNSSTRANTFYLGVNGVGVLNYNSEATSDFNRVLRVGANATGDGTLNVTNGTINFLGSYLILSNSGKATLNLEGGNVKAAGSFYTGDAKSTTSHTTINVKGLYENGSLVRSSTLTSPGTLSLSDKDGTQTVVNVGEGGTFTSVTTKIGYSNHWNDESNDGGHVEFNVAGGGFSSSEDVYVGRTSAINVSSGNFSAAKRLVIYGTAQQGFDASSINVTGGTFSVAGTLTQYDDTTLAFDTDLAEVSLGGLTMNGGTLSLKGYNTTDALLEVSGNVALNGADIVLNVDESYWETHTYGDDIALISATGAFDWDEAFVSMMSTNALPETHWSLFVDGNTLYAHVGVPEPATWVLLLLGGAFVLWRRRRVAAAS
ncbi:MAG: PEP-CTERM sorting domain-containing protein [Planctomycetia bacterium]|nr:PEP-CTERM sorting domain-containing protein [Planctomycetia bacterium]